MTPRTILVHVDETDAWRIRLDTALTILGDDAATGHVLGICGVVDVNEGHPYSRQVSGDFLARVDGQEAPFRAACEERGLSCSWHAVRGADATVVATQLAANLQTADLGIVSQPRPEDAGHAIPIEVIEQIAAAGGRPLLVLPYITKRFTMPRRAVVALDDDSAGARALADAVGFMGQCDLVTLLAIGRDPVALNWRWEAHRDALGRHGITAEIEHEAPTDIPVSELILSRCADLAAEMLAMGAHVQQEGSLLRRSTVTRAILPGLTLPMLLSR